MKDPVPGRMLRNLIIGLLLGGLLLLGYLVLRPFVVPVLWAMIIAYATWTWYVPLRTRFGTHTWLSALVMTLLLTLAFVVPAVWVAMLMREEIGFALTALGERLEQGGLVLPPAIRSMPWFGEALQNAIDQTFGDPDALRVQVTEWVKEGSERVVGVIGDVGRNAAKLGFAFITLFFLFRDGERVVDQVYRVFARIVGERVDDYMTAVGVMARAVVWGLVATAFAQGFVAGLGYWWADVPAPVLMGTMTAILAMIPFGAPLAWGSISLWLIGSGRTTEGVGLMLWGMLVVSWVDNFLRPLVISSATRIPFLLVMFGVLGGLAAFGLVGLFLGPVILAVLMAVWREWIGEAERRLLIETDTTMSTEIITERDHEAG